MFLPVVKPIFRIVARIFSFLVFAITVLAAYGGRINPEYLAFPSILVLALPYLAIASMVITAAWLCAGRYITAAIGVLAIVAAWGPISNAVPLHFSSKPDNEARTIKLLTYNILHGIDQEQPEGQTGNRAFEFVMNSGADIVSLQELYRFSDSEIPNFTQELRDSLFRIYPYQAGSNTSDLKVLSRFPVRLVKEYSPSGNGTGHFSLYEVDTPSGKLNWINMHLNSYNLTDKERGIMKEIASVKSAKEGVAEMKGPIRRKLSDSFRDRAVEARELALVVEQLEGPVIVSGDFNDVPESYAYRTVRSAGLDDACAETTFGPMITYNRHAFWFHLDQIFYKGNIRPLRVKKHSIRSSDHYPLTAEFEFIGKGNR